MTSNLLFASAVAILAWALMTGCIQLADDIVKSEKDMRQYRGLTLENGIKTVLISDEKLEQAAATLAVHVGHLSDPDNMPGMAHFCEHMLFMGSDKYPEEDHFNKMVSIHGGSRNAHTYSDRTTYAFDVGAEYLEKVLDAFSSYFIAPRFNKSTVAREMNAVNNEVGAYVSSDGERLRRVYHIIANPDHSYRKLFKGKRIPIFEEPEAKGLEPDEEVRKFWEKWYSSNIMTLAIAGKETLDELQDYAVRYFSKIENKNIEAPSWKNPFVPTTLKKWVEVKTLYRMNKITFVFPTKDFRQLYRSRPDIYVGELLNSGRSGTLTTWLKKQGWAESVEASTESLATGFGRITVAVTLANDGEKHIKEIGQALFQALNKIRQGPHRRIFDEMRRISEIGFRRYYDETGAAALTGTMAPNMLIVPIPEVLEYIKLNDYRPEEINMLLESLTPDNMFIIREWSRFNSSELENKEPYYNVSYSVKPIPRWLMRKLRDPGQNKYFKHPLPNPYIPNNIDLKPIDSANGHIPELIQSDDLFHVWYHQDKEYQTPEGDLWISASDQSLSVKLNWNFWNKLKSPLVNVDPYHASMKSLLVRWISNTLEEQLAAISDIKFLSYIIYSDKFGITIRTSGYPEKQEELVKDILQHIATSKISPDRLKTAYNSYARNPAGMDVLQPTGEAIRTNLQLLEQNYWSLGQYRKAVKGITVKKLERFRRQFLSQLHIDIFGCGNYERKDLLRIATLTKKIVTDDAETASVLPNTIKMNRYVQLSHGENSLFQILPPADLQTESLTFYECGGSNVRSKIIVRLIRDIIEPRMFNQLRTIEQLGYYVNVLLSEPDAPAGIILMIGNSPRDPVYLEKRIESFLAKIKDELPGMTAKEFTNQKEGFAIKRFRRPDKLSDKTIQFWTEIQTQQYNFEERELEKPILENITLNDVVEMFNKCLSPKSKERKRLRVWDVGMRAIRSGYKPKSACEGEVSCIEDPTEFRASRILAPYPKPFKSFEEIESSCPRNCRHQSGMTACG